MPLSSGGSPRGWWGWGILMEFLVGLQIPTWIEPLKDRSQVGSASGSWQARCSRFCLLSRWAAGWAWLHEEDELGWTLQGPGLCLPPSSRPQSLRRTCSRWMKEVSPQLQGHCSHLVAYSIKHCLFTSHLKKLLYKGKLKVCEFVEISRIWNYTFISAFGCKLTPKVIWVCLLLI